ncbi:MAG TPA: response regulator [Stenomitos sp.]
MSTILIADESRLMQRNLTMTLQRAGYDLLLASSGYDALAVCSRQTPDLLLMDCGMTNMSGTEATRIIRTNPATQHLPIILMSSEDRELRNARFVGANDTILKPIETKELLAKVNRLLAPMPEADRPITLMGPEGPLQTKVIRVLGTRQIALPPVPLELKPSQPIEVVYDAAGGVQIKRDTTVHSLMDDGVVLTLGTNVSVEQRRRHFRKQVEIAVRYRLPGDFFRLGKTLDISGGGMRLTGVGGHPELGQTLDFQLVLDPSMFITVQGVIRRLIPTEHERFEVGVEFLAIDPKVQQELTMFLFAGVDQVPT